MKRRTPCNSVRLFLAILLGLLITGPAAAQKGKGGGGSTPAVYYRVTPVLLNSPCYVSDLNASSAAIGYIRAPEERIAFVWTKETGIIPLQSLLSVSDQQQWHLEVLEGINDFGQIVGFASIQGGDPNRAWSAFRLDWPNGWLNGGATLTILDEGRDNLGGRALQISNAGDVVMSVFQETTYYYPANYPASARIDLEFPLSVTGLNAFGEIIGDTDSGGVRLTLNSGGGYSTKLFSGQPLAINDAGTIAGRAYDGNSQYCLFRYSENSGESVLKDGRKIISGWVRGINNAGDIGITGPAVFTAEGKYLKLNDLIHPNDSAGYRGHEVRGIASRNQTGLPPVIVQYPSGTTGGSPSFQLYDTFFLTPESSGN